MKKSLSRLRWLLAFPAALASASVVQLALSSVLPTLEGFSYWKGISILATSFACGVAYMISGIAVAPSSKFSASLALLTFPLVMLVLRLGFWEGAYSRGEKLATIGLLLGAVLVGATYRWKNPP